MISNIFTNPGADCSKEVNITWHSDMPESFIVYTLADDTEFKSARLLSGAGEKNAAQFSNSEVFYHFSVCLSGLVPGTQYIYKLKDADGESVVHSFKTASGDAEPFCFAWMCDVHANKDEHEKMSQVDLLMERIKAHTGDPAFILFGGDAVDRGGRYSDWVEWDSSSAVRDHIFAMIVGNHEYYTAQKQKRVTNLWFNDMQSPPSNGVPGLKSTFWFIYNRVMFVALDIHITEATEVDDSIKALSLQQDWFKKAVAEQRPNFDRLIVHQHFPFFVSSNGGEKCYYGGYENWYSLFDECGVDFALCGDYHCYVRTRHLRSDRPHSTSGGTVYITGPQIPSNFYVSDIRPSENELIATTDTASSTTGACFFSVTPDGITFSMINGEGEIVDSDFVS